MKLSDIEGMKEYLENRCYCPGEIYDMSGFFYNVFKPDTECKLFCEGEHGAIHGKFVIAQADEKSKPQIIYIEIDKKNAWIKSCVRLDATEHNIWQINRFMRGEIEKMSFDEYDGHSTAEDLKKLFEIADAVML